MHACAETSHAFFCEKQSVSARQAPTHWWLTQLVGEGQSVSSWHTPATQVAEGPSHSSPLPHSALSDVKQGAHW